MPVDDALAGATTTIAESLRRDGTLFVAGNGGSFADALHVAGELAKNFERDRPLPPALRARLLERPGREQLADQLQAGLRVIVLGSNPVLTSAVDNDLALRHLGLAQELGGLGRPDDVLLAISTSGASRNLINAAAIAHAIGMTVIALTGPSESELSGCSDIVIRAAGSSTAEIQAAHVEQYHDLCRGIERAMFPK